MGKHSIQSASKSQALIFQPKSLRLTFSALLGLLLFSGSSIAQSDYLDLELGDLSRNNRIESDETKFFRVKVPSREYDVEKDLVIKVFSEGQQQGDPDVYISRTNKKPNRAQNSEWTCSTYGKDTCTISGKEFRPDDTFYVGVRCGSTQDGQCTFSIQPTMTGELLLEDGVEQQIDFNQNEAKLFKFYIPANSVRSRDNEDYRIKSVVITAVPLLPIDEKMSLYASTKGSVTADKTSKKGTPGWRKGQTLRISEDDDQKEWCTDCYVKILLDVTTKGKYQILAKTNVGIVTLQEGVKLDDVSFYGDRQCYKYFVRDPKTELNVRFAQFSGISSLTFNPKEIPAKFEDALYKKSEFGNAALVITSQDRQANASATGLYYLCIFSHMTATYSIQIIERSSSQTFHYLEDGWDESGEVQGRDLNVYVYKVPPLDFKGEDISIEFQLGTQAGETPKMYGRFCKETRKCGEKITNETLYSPSSGFLSARAVGKGLSIIIDHDEDTCQKLHNNECYYTIVVQGQGRKEGDISKFSITTMHSQENYFVLQEGVPVSDYVSMGSYRYYSFTIPPPNSNGQRDPKVKNVSFQLNSLHGDADIFVSRKHKYPNRMDYERNSVKTADSFDMVFFDDSKEDLTGTYYVGVYSYQYSTYSLVATVQRVDQSGRVVSFLGINDEGLQGQSLIEGVSQRGSMHSKDTQLFRIKIKQLQGYEKAIKIQVSPLEGHFKIRAQFDVPPNKDSAVFRTDGHFLQINPKDPNFKREGTLYILVFPKANFIELLDVKKNYQYLLTYTTEDSYFYLKSQYPLEMKQPASKDSYNYFRHFVGTLNKDVSLSMTVFSGSPVLYATFNPDDKWPQVESENTLSTRNQAVMVNAAKGKALYFPKKVMQKANVACSGELVDSQVPCVLFASVLCEPSTKDGKSSKDDECKYALKLSYESAAPQPVIVGQPQHNVVKDGTFNYYYLSIKESTIHDNQQIMAVLSSMRGNVDLYVSFRDTPQSSNPDTWVLPNQNEYVYKSTQTGLGNQDMIKIDAKKDQNLKDCFDRFLSRFGSERECAIVFGVFSPTLKGKEEAAALDNIALVDKFSSRYNFVVYMDLMQLMSQAPVSGQVEAGEFQYYHFESTCVDCTIMMSLSTVGTGDPDLYVNFGDDRLPNRENSDMRSSTFKSEMLTINLNHPHFKAGGIKSMKGPFVIGVYGVKRSNYTLVVSQEKYPIQLLMDNTALKASQEPFEIIYYAWYNMQVDDGQAKDFKLSLNIKNGQADIYLTTYSENERAKDSESTNMLAKLPKSKRDVQWIREGITPKSGDTKKSLMVLNNEKNYCAQCFYLIGIVTHDLKTDYSLQIDLLDANYKNAQILKLGELYTSSFTPEQTDRTRVYRFILDEVSPVQFIQTVQNAAVTTKLSFSETGEPAILYIEDSQVAELPAEDKDFQLGKMYYLVITERSNKQGASHQIMLMQNRTVIRLADGVPTRVKYQGKKDTSKLLIFSIPDGSYTFSVQIKSKTQDFYPRLYVKYYENLEDKWRNLEFPPGGEPGYFICKQWDYKLGVLNYEEQFDNIVGGKAGLVLNLVEASTTRDTVEDAEVLITVSATPVLKVVEGSTYIGNLPHAKSYKIYQVDEDLTQKPGFLAIEFTPCVGDTEFNIVENANQGRNQISSESKQFTQAATQFKHGRYFKYIPLPRDQVNILVRQKEYQGEPERDIEGNIIDYSADYMIKVRHTNKMNSMKTEYFLPSDGKLFLSVLDGNQGVDLKWGHLYYSDFSGNAHYGEGVNYTVIATKDKRARLDTQCVLRKEVSSKFIMATFGVDNQNKFNFKMPVEGERYYVNVIAKVQSKYEEEAEFIPYKPTELYITSRSFMSQFVLLLFIVVVVAFLAGALYFYKKSKYVEERIEYEMTDVRNVASVGKSIEMATIDRKEKQKGFAKVGEYESVSVTGINDGVDESQYADTVPTKQL